MSLFEDIANKAKALKTNHEQRKTAEKEDALTKREAELSAKEAQLKKLASSLKKQSDELLLKEKQLDSRKRLPLYVFLACIGIFVGFFLLLLKNYELNPRNDPRVAEALKMLVDPPAAVEKPYQSGPVRASDCYSKGVEYYKEIGSYPTLSSAPYQGKPADMLIHQACSKNPQAFGWQ